MSEQSLESQAKKSGNMLVSTLEDVFRKAPALPLSAINLLVTLTPWLALVFGVLGLLGSVAGLGLGSVMGPLLAVTGAPAFVAGSFVYFLVALVSSALMLAAVPGLLSKKMGGWTLLFWSEVVSVVASLVSFNVSSLFMTVLFAAISFYLLFQIRSHYK